MPHTEGPSNWLSKIIKRVRKSIDRPLPGRERREERDAILAEIRSHSKGAELASKPNLAEVVMAALKMADELEQQPKDMYMSPAVKASYFIFDELGVPHPEYEN